MFFATSLQPTFPDAFVTQQFINHSHVSLNTMKLHVILLSSVIFH